MAKNQPKTGRSARHAWERRLSNGELAEPRNQNPSNKYR